MDQLIKRQKQITEEIKKVEKTDFNKVRELLKEKIIVDRKLYNLRRENVR